MPKFVQYTRSKKFDWNLGAEDFFPPDKGEDPATKKRDAEEKITLTSQGEQGASGFTSKGQPMTSTVSKELTKSADDRIKLAEQVLTSKGLTSRERRTWHQEYREAWKARDEIVLEINEKSGFSNYSDKVIDFQTESEARKLALVSGSISDIKTTDPIDLEKIRTFADTLEIKGSEAKEMRKIPDLWKDPKEVEAGKSFTQGTRNMQANQVVGGNFGITSISDRADVSGAKAITHEVDPVTGKKIKLETPLPDLESGMQKVPGLTFWSDMQAIAQGPFGINEIGLGGENKSMEIAKYDKASYEAVGKRLAGGNWKDFESVVKNPSLAKASSHPRFQEYKSLHRRIEKEASIYKAISEDIKIQSAQYLESGKPEAARISEAGKVNKQTISDYFSGKYPGASFANVESASIYGGKSLSEQAKLHNLPSGNLPGGQPVDKPIDVTAGQGSKPKVFTSPGGRTIKSGLPSYGEQKVVSGGYVRSYDKPNTVFPRSPLETTQQKKIDENLKALRAAMKKAAAVGGGVGIRGIIGIGKKGGGGSAFSK